MELLEHFRRQFAHDAWANREVLAGLKAGAGSSPKPLQLLAHILSAETLWLERIKKLPQSFAVWPEFSAEQCGAQIVELSRLWPEFLSQLEVATLAETITYTNSRGERWTDNVGDVLTHVLLHSAHHRGQIAILVRADGGQPAQTDFIHAARQSLIE